jgi:tRNA (guanine-N1)-methyltransferase
LYRHWDHFTGEKRSHLFLLTIASGALSDLTPNDPHDVPPFSLEGSGCGCAFAPDSKELAFTENLDEEPAISTSAKIFTLDLTSTAAKPVAISTSETMKGGNFNPAYSPDGKYLAWRSQARNGYESDKFRLMVYTRSKSSKSASQQVSEPAVDGQTTEDQHAGPRSTPITFAISAQGRLSAPTAAAVSAQDDNSVSGTPGLAGGTRVILLSAQGGLFTQAVARELAGAERVVLICGRYEGVDERINELYCDMELSIGDYVLSGGELAAAVVVDATMRLIPGVLGNEASAEFESFGAADAEIAEDVDGVPRSQHGAGGLLDYPQYTRPAEFGGLRAPEVLMNGDHAEIRRWRREQQLRKTFKNRPELLEQAQLSAEDVRMLKTIRGDEGL